MSERVIYCASHNEDMQLKEITPQRNIPHGQIILDGLNLELEV